VLLSSLSVLFLVLKYTVYFTCNWFAIGGVRSVWEQQWWRSELAVACPTSMLTTDRCPEWPAAWQCLWRSMTLASVHLIERQCVHEPVDDVEQSKCQRKHSPRDFVHLASFLFTFRVNYPRRTSITAVLDDVNLPTHPDRHSYNITASQLDGCSVLC